MNTPNRLDKETELGALLSTHLAKEIEPPHAEFFTKSILDTLPLKAPKPARASRYVFFQSLWKKYAYAMSFASLALSFYGGMQLGHHQEALRITQQNSPQVYTPEERISARVFELNSREEAATIIVLDGLEALAQSDIGMESKEGHKPIDLSS